MVFRSEASRLVIMKAFLRAAEGSSDFFGHLRPTASPRCPPVHNVCLHEQRQWVYVGTKLAIFKTRTGCAEHPFPFLWFPTSECLFVSIPGEGLVRHEQSGWSLMRGEIPPPRSPQYGSPYLILNPPPYRHPLLAFMCLSHCKASDCSSEGLFFGEPVINALWGWGA